MAFRQPDESPRTTRDASHACISGLRCRADTGFPWGRVYYKCNRFIDHLNRALGVITDYIPGQVFRKVAIREVVVSAGATRTPQLLLLSGIGNKTTLEGHNITSIVDLPDVGQRLQDHLFVPFQFLVNSTLTFDSIDQSTVLAEETLNQYLMNGTGFLVNGLANHLAFLRVPQSTFRNGRDPSAGPNSPHIEFAFCVSVARSLRSALNSVFPERLRLDFAEGSVHRELSDSRNSKR